MTKKIGTSIGNETQCAHEVLVLLVSNDHIDSQSSSTVKFALRATTILEPMAQKREEFYHKIPYGLQQIHYVPV